MKKTLKTAVCFCIAMVMLLCGCTTGAQSAPSTQSAASQGAAAENKVAETKDSLVYEMASDPGTIDPYASMALNLRLSSQVVETLCEYNDVGELTPRLATSWDYDEDGMGLTVHLREGVKFTNGDDFTSEDILFSISKMKENATYVGALKAINLDNVSAIDEYTIYMPLNMESGTVHNSLTNFFVVNKTTYDEKHALEIIGTGPFVVDKYVTGDSVTFHANEDYWDGAPAVKNLTIRFVAEASTRFTDLQNGACDLIDAPLGEDIARTKAGSEKGIKYIESYKGDKVQFFGINCAVITDKNVRKALCLLVDQNAVFQSAYSGLGTVATNILPAGWWYSDSEAHNPETDPDQAVELLKAAGYSDTNKLHIRMAYASNLAERTSAAEIINGAFAKTGLIEVEMLGAELQQTNERLNSTNDYEVFLLNMGNLFEPLTALTQKFAASNSVIGGSGNFRIISTESGAKIDELITLAAKTSDDAERAKIYVELQRLIAGEYCFVGFLDQYNYGLCDEGLTGVWWQPNPAFKKASYTN